MVVCVLFYPAALEVLLYPTATCMAVCAYVPCTGRGPQPIHAQSMYYQFRTNDVPPGVQCTQTLLWTGYFTISGPDIAGYNEI